MAKQEKSRISPELRKIWLRIRQAWNMSHDAFASSISRLGKEQLEMLYDLVKLSLYKASHAEMLREHPELREIVFSDEDRLCMHDVYEVLSWRLGKSEPEPKDVIMRGRLKGRIGRSVPEIQNR